MASVVAEKPHVVCMPFPLQGHINAMMQLAKLLHLYGFRITFVHSEFNYKRILKSQGPSLLAGLPDFCFEAISDGLPPSDVDAPQDVQQLCESTRKQCLLPFQELIMKLNDASSGVPPVTCIISDVVATFTLQISEELKIPNVFFCSFSASSFWCLFHFKQLIERGVVPLKSECDLSENLNTIVDGIPGLKNIRMKDLPSFVRTTDPEDFFLNYAKDQNQLSLRASAMIFNTFDDLEVEVLDEMTSMLPPIYTVGPLTLLLRGMPRSLLASGSSNMWKEDSGCFEWLNSRNARSVVYVNFGSITVLTKEHLIEFAWGLANSMYDFLWVIRPDLVMGETLLLPAEFLAQTENRGLTVSWCPQERVLSHPAIGVFLTHCGWNSMMETISFGVPIICWPFFGDQQTNCYFARDKWRIGKEIDNNVKTEEVEGLIRELMGGEKGKEMTKKATEWKESAIRATEEGGSSFENLRRSIEEVLLPK